MRLSRNGPRATNRWPNGNCIPIAARNCPGASAAQSSATEQSAVLDCVGDCLAHFSRLRNAVPRVVPP